MESYQLRTQAGTAAVTRERTAAPRAPALEAIRTRLPTELLELPIWLLWKDQDKRKIPIYADGSQRRGKLDSPDDRGRLVTFDQAVSAAHRIRPTGLGIALGPIPGADKIVSGIDLDHCYTADGELDECVPEIMAAAASYTERSPSGEGVHILGWGDIGTTKTRAVEIYSGARYFTVTGDALNRAGLADLTDAAAVARRLYQTDKGSTRATPNGAPVGAAALLTDADWQRVRQALDSIDPATAAYDDWLTVGMALHSTGHREAFGAWNQWSSRDEARYQGTDDLANRWRGFSSDRESVVTWRSLLSMAEAPARRDADGDAEPEKRSAASRLVDIAQERYAFGVSEQGEAFALPKDGPKLVHLLRGSRTSLRAELAREYFRRTRKAAPQQALADALLVIEGMANEAEPTPLHLRVAKTPDALWLDLGDQSGRAVKITGEGWSVEPEAPVLFKRTVLTGALPVPERGGTLEDLWKRLNVQESDRPLIATWLASALEPDLPHAVLGVRGENGTGKTTVTKMVVTLVDPGPVPTRKPPRDADSWVTAAQGSWVVALDNVSDVPAWLSDSICRAVTGDGDVRRKLYTDGEHAVFAFRRAVILNSIDLGASRGDLAERMLPIQLEVIPEPERLAEDEIWPTWKAEHPRILGALLDLAAGIAGVLPSVRLESKPRMADFAKRLAAVDMLLGTNGLDQYLGKQKSLATDSLSGDSFIGAMQARVTEFHGTAAELLEELTPADRDWRKPKDWPALPRIVTQRLRRFAPALRKAGWTVTDHGDGNHRNTTLWTVRRPEIAGNSSSPTSQPRTDTPDREDARKARKQNEQSQDEQGQSCDEVLL